MNKVHSYTIYTLFRLRLDLPKVTSTVPKFSGVSIKVLSPPIPKRWCLNCTITSNSALRIKPLPIMFVANTPPALMPPPMMKWSSVTSDFAVVVVAGVSSVGVVFAHGDVSVLLLGLVVVGVDGFSLLSLLNLHCQRLSHLAPIDCLCRSLLSSSWWLFLNFPYSTMAFW